MKQNAPGSDLPGNDLRRWLWIAAIWFAVGLFEATQTVFTMRAAGMHHAWTRLFFMLLLGWLPLMLFTPNVLRLGRGHPPAQWRRSSFWLVHVPACLGLCLLAAAWSAGLERWLNPWTPDLSPPPFLNLWLMKFENSLLAYLILYSSILAIGHSLDSQERLARKETEAAQLNEQLSEARLRALRHQIEPHFLFNTLNAVAGLVRERRNDDAVSMIAGLSDFLRGVMQDSGKHEVALGEEIKFLQKYLDIQKVRFAERLQVSLDVPEELFAARVPSLLLQPIVENAVKHGIAQRAQGGAIRIAAHRRNGTLHISVYNDGPGMTMDCLVPAGGIGISNLRRRLQSMYGDNFQFELRNQEARGVEALIAVPYVVAKSEKQS
jgi:hypothetical protein